MKKTFVLILAAVSITQAKSQCFQQNVIPVISGAVNFKYGYMAGEAKIGLWHNVHPSGVTAFVGYLDGQPVKNDPPKAEEVMLPTWNQYRLVNTAFLEVGYKRRLNDKLFLHTFGGINSIRKYIGADLLYQANWDLMIGVGYKEQMGSFKIVFRFYNKESKSR